MAVSAPLAVLDEVVGDLPTGWKVSADSPPAAVEWQFAITPDPAYGFRIRDGIGEETLVGELRVAIGLMRTHLRRFVGYHAKDLVFVHAGVVARAGRAIVIPGHSFSGKSTLVAALVEQGATLYSDEYAVLDEQGLVHPYLDPVALRDAEGLHSRRLTAADLGGEAGEDAIPVGLVALITYAAGANWNPRELSAAQGVFAVLEHAIPVQDRPEQTLRVVRRALEHASVLAGERGEAAEAARKLLESL